MLYAPAASLRSAHEPADLQQRFQVASHACLRSATTLLLQGILSRVWQLARVCAKLSNRFADFMVGVRKLAFGVLYFRHVAVDTGHVVLTIECPRSGFIFRVLRFERGVFDSEFVQSGRRWRRSDYTYFSTFMPLIPHGNLTALFLPSKVVLTWHWPQTIDC